MVLLTFPIFSWNQTHKTGSSKTSHREVQRIEENLVDGRQQIGAADHVEHAVQGPLAVGRGGHTVHDNR